MSSETKNDAPFCLAIGGLDPSGGAGLLADTRAFTRFGCRTVAAVTSVTFQNSIDMSGAEHQSADSVRRQILAVLDEHSVAAVKTGMLPTAEIVEAIAAIVAERHLPNLVIDPVLRSSSGHQLIDDAALAALLGKLLPLSVLITPNVPEIEQITGISIEDIDDISAAAAILHEMGARGVLIKGGHMPNSINTDAEGNRISKDFLFHNGQMTVLENEFIPDKNIRGTGCMLASAIAANLALVEDLPRSVRSAKTFVNDLISGN